MSEQNPPQEYDSTSPLPPREHRQDDSGWGMAVPTLLTLGTGLAALWLIENQTHAISSTARRARDATGELWSDAGDWAQDHWHETSRRARLFGRDASHRATETAGHWRESVGDGLISAGAKAAGIAGMLKALGGGALSTGASRAARLVALREIAKHATKAARQLKESAAESPALHEGSQRLRGAYGALRGRPVRRSDEHELGTMQMALIGVALVGAGAAASYFLNTDSGPQRRRALRLRTQALGRRASDWAQDLAQNARGSTNPH